MTGWSYRRDGGGDTFSAESCARIVRAVTESQDKDALRRLAGAPLPHGSAPRTPANRGYEHESPEKLGAAIVTH